ncbi:hypothetical protein WEI85_44930 [Actinomycetes bacterium KLBMP 9797]
MRIAFVAAGLVIALLGGIGIGRLTSDPGGTTAAAPTVTPAPTDHAHAAGTGAHTHGTTGAAAAGARVGGLEINTNGYALAPVTTAFPVGQRRDLTFRVTGPDNRPVTTFAVVHDKPLHLIVVRRDLSGYQHLHPTMAPDGTWAVPLTLPAAGVWRAYADFTAVDAAGSQTPLTLGMDLTVSGAYAARPLPAPERAARVGGFSIGYEGTPCPGATQPLLFRVAPGGLERYLGAYGHLVVLREGDLGYVHVHPEPELADGAVKFWLAAPSSGRYRMFFDFQVAGQVHTAEFTLVVD